MIWSHSALMVGLLVALATIIRVLPALVLPVEGLDDVDLARLAAGDR